MSILLLLIIQELVNDFEGFLEDSLDEIFIKVDEIKIYSISISNWEKNQKKQIR